MSAPAVLRVIRFDEARRRNGERGLVVIGLLILVAAAIFSYTAPPNEMDPSSVWLVIMDASVVLPAYLFARRGRQSPVYVTADEEGLIWGTDRSRDLSLPWMAIAKVRGRDDPYRQGVMYSFSFEPLAGYHSPGQQRDVRRTGIGAYVYTVDTRIGDCQPDEFRDLIASRRPDLPILFGSFIDPA